MEEKPVDTDRRGAAQRPSRGEAVRRSVAGEQGEAMSSKRTWFITGAGRGMGVDFARAALGAGHAVVASGRDSARVSKTLGQSNDLLAVMLDVTKRTEAEAAVRSAVDRF